VSYSSLFVGTALGFTSSAILVLVAQLPCSIARQQATTFWQRLPLGIMIFARAKTLQFLMLTNVVVAAGTALVLVNSVVYARGLFGLDDAALAFSLASFGAGSLVVAINVPWVTERIGVIRTMVLGMGLIVSGLIAAVILTATGSTNVVGWGGLLATWALLGMGTSLVSTPSARLLADAATPANRNLVYTAQFALSHACFLITYPVAGWLGARSLTLAALVLLAIALSAAATAATFAFAHKLRTQSEALASVASSQDSSD
jgi:MFS family permease